MFISDDPLVNRKKKTRQKIEAKNRGKKRGFRFIYDVSNLEFVKMFVSLHELKNKIID